MAPALRCELPTPVGVQLLRRHLWAVQLAPLPQDHPSITRWVEGRDGAVHARRAGWADAEPAQIDMVDYYEMLGVRPRLRPTPASFKPHVWQDPSTKCQAAPGGSC